MMKKTFLIILLFISYGLFAADDDALVVKANKAYSAGAYQQAATLYQQVVSNGFEASELYYNLGNAYFKCNDMPSAILYYEKALKLNPRDEYVKNNIQVANTKITDKILPLPELFYQRWWNALQNLFEMDTWAIILIVNVVLFFIAISFYLISNTMLIRKASFWCGILLFIFSTFSFLFASNRYHTLTRQKEAIIFSPSLTVKSSPDDNSTDLFILHEGTKVSVTDKVGQWREVKIANGSVGWVKAETFREI
jgi:tetratricopeptide (TPR) repeat protein